MYCWIHFANILFRITLLCLPNALRCFFSCCFEKFWEHYTWTSHLQNFCPFIFARFLFLPSQFYNLSFLQQIYNLLCLFSTDSMNMCPGLSTSKCLINAEYLFWRTQLLSQQPLTTSSILFSFLFTFSTRLDLVEIPQSLSACQLVVSLCCIY